MRSAPSFSKMKAAMMNGIEENRGNAPGSLMRGPAGLMLAWAAAVALRRPLRSTNMLVWVNREIRRRTRVAGLFPNEQSPMRLVGAVLVEISEDRETGKKYVCLNSESHPKIRNSGKRVAQPRESEHQFQYRGFDFQ